jgi:hypothetical protein
MPLPATRPSALTAHWLSVRCRFRGSHRILLPSHSASA